MSQELIYLIIKELGGTAHIGQIKELAKKKYPESTLYSYVNDRLRKLRGWGYIRKNSDSTYTIIKNYP